MNPIIERLSEQPKQWWEKGEKLVTPLVERVQERSEKLREKGTEILADLQERQEKLFERGQQALTTFEVSALERVEEILGWAYGITGEKSEVLKKSREFVGERLEELRKAAESVAEALAKAEPEAGSHNGEAKAEAAPEQKLEPPFEGYDETAAKKLVQRIAELDRETLLAVKAYEEQTRARKSVLEAVERHLS